MNQLKERIASACATTEPMTKERNKALKQIKWRLKSGLLYAGLKGLQSVLVSADEALVFDGRDNEETKIKFYEAIMKPYKFEVEIVA